MRTRNVVVGLISLLFVALWVYAGLQKLLDLPNFRNQMAKSPMLTAMAPILAYAVPLGELAIAYLLLYRRTRLLGLYASLFLMVQFITYLFLIVNYSFYVPCACGGIIGGMDWTAHIFFNAGFAALAILGIVLHGRVDSAKATTTVVASATNMELDYQ